MLSDNGEIKHNNQSALGQEQDNNNNEVNNNNKPKIQQDKIIIMPAWYDIHYEEMATISITDIADNCFVPHDSLKIIESLFTHCLFCETTRTYEIEIFKGDCYSNSGTNRQNIIICSDCIREYDRLIGYPSRLVVADQVEDAEDEIIAACQAAATKTPIASIPLLDFYKIATQAFENNRNVENILTTILVTSIKIIENFGLFAILCSKRLVSKIT